MEDVKSSILQMAKGAIQERVDYEVAKVIDNILQPIVKAGVGNSLVIKVVKRICENNNRFDGADIVIKAVEITA